MAASTARKLLRHNIGCITPVALSVTGAQARVGACRVQRRWRCRAGDALLGSTAAVGTAAGAMQVLGFPLTSPVCGVAVAAAGVMGGRASRESGSAWEVAAKGMWCGGFAAAVVGGVATKLALF
mmetsp:Transcript_67057/g.216230  ORF Transcript_67057/g.216230 Transcript_67057/m.216230 type:complete len:124 (-) Transcript_67057:124-495(-)